jgi:glycosyltransferase involved in cell wall biosynthesis
MMAGDIFLSTSLNEGISYSILEAQAASLPVVAVNAGAMSEIVIDGVNGFLVQPIANEIVSKILDLKNDRNLLKSTSIKRGKGNLTEVAQNNSATRHVEVYEIIQTGLNQI